MKQLKTKLLLLLEEHAGETVDITPLVKEYANVPIDYIYDEDDNTIKKIQEVNNLLSDLSNMGWIRFNPTSGFSTASTGASEIAIGKRRILTPVTVQAVMTTKGEIEYKKSQEDSRPKISVGDNFSGMLSGGDISHSHLVQASGSSEVIASQMSSTPKDKSKSPSNKLLKVIGGIIAIILAALKIFGII